MDLTLFYDKQLEQLEKNLTNFCLLYIHYVH